MSVAIRGTELTGQDLIPGGFEPRALRPRQSGGMSGPASGSTEQPGASNSMDAATIDETRRAGGRLKNQKGE
jgi:hypothetical protein